MSPQILPKLEEELEYIRDIEEGMEHYIYEDIDRVYVIIRDTYKEDEKEVTGATGLELEAVTEALRDYGAEISDSIRETGHNIAGRIESMGQDILSGIRESLEYMERPQLGLSDVITDTLWEVGGWVKDSINTVRYTLAGVIDGIKLIAKGMKDGVVETFKRMAEWQKESEKKTEKYIQTVLGELRGFIKDEIERIKKSLPYYFDMLREFIKLMLEEFKNILLSALQSTIEFIKAVAKGIGEVMISAIKFLLKGLKDLLEIDLDDVMRIFKWLFEAQLKLKADLVKEIVK